MGFSIAYCDDDGNGRENFIGSISGGLDSWIDADLFGQLNLLDSSKTNIDNNVFKRRNQNDLQVYPNPVSEVLHINQPDQSTISKISIFSLNGKLIFESNYSGNSNTVNVSNLKNGMYTIVVQGEAGINSKVFQKE